jgi:hypothetical protein
MVDFSQMPPVDPQKRIDKLYKLQRLQNGAKFEYGMTLKDGRIHGRYLDYAGEWCVHTWDKNGRVSDRRFAEMDIDWKSENV